MLPHPHAQRVGAGARIVENWVVFLNDKNVRLSLQRGQLQQLQLVMSGCTAIKGGGEGDLGERVGERFSGKI